MSTEATRAVYNCPHCRLELETRPGPWSGWLRCPRCGRDGRPPEAQLRPVVPPVDKARTDDGPGRRPPDSWAEKEEEVEWRPRPAPGVAAGRRPRLRIEGVLAASGLGIALFLLGFALVDNNRPGAAVLGLISVLLSVVVVQLEKKR